jgi:hypothetical protein
MRTRRLALSRETLTELATTDLAAVAGGATTTPVATPTQPLDDCVALFSKVNVCDSYLRPCISHTCTR